MKVNKKLLLSTSLLMPILPIFATISCNNKKTNDSTEQQFDLTKLETGFYNIPADYFSNSGVQLAGGLYFVLNNENDENEKEKMYSDLGAYYKALLNGVQKPPTKDFIIVDKDKISKPNQVAILDETTIDFDRVASANFKETNSDKLVEISVTPKPKNGSDNTQKTTYELRTVELTNQFTLRFTAKADLYSVSTNDKLNATLELVEGDKIDLSVTKTFDDNAELNKRDKVTILVKKSTQS